MGKEWGDLDFPIWVEWGDYNDTWKLADNIEFQHDVDDVPDYSTFKYVQYKVWFKIEEDGSVEGPFDEKEGEKI